MKISTKGRYALRMLVDMAENQSGSYITLSDIAMRQAISKKYLEQIAVKLTRAGILHAVRGHMGGYMLVKSPEQYTLGEILRITEGPLAPVACLERQPNRCGRCSFCRTLPIWEGLSQVINEYVDGITLKDAMGSKGTGSSDFVDIV